MDRLKTLGIPLFMLSVIAIWTVIFTHANEANACSGGAGTGSSADELLYCVFLEEPRFGGFSAAPENPDTALVWITGEEGADRAAARALAAINRLWARSFTRAITATADYTIGDLATWAEAVTKEPPDWSAGLDLDESRNRIALIVKDQETDLAHTLASLGVPTNAVTIDRPLRTAPPASMVEGLDHQGEPFRQDTQALDWSLSPFVGGGEISQYSAGTGFKCTAGFLVAFLGHDDVPQQGFATAGHCGPEQAKFRSRPDQQLGQSALNLLQRGRGMDFQYVEYQASSRAVMGPGYIARPGRQNTTGERATRGLKLLDPKQPYFEISGGARAAVGDLVHKVGRTTGWTSGKVLRTCFTPLVQNFKRTNRMKCSDIADLSSMDGDSGSPVFSVDAGGRVTLRGVLFAGSGVFAPVDQILEELFRKRGATQVRVPPIRYGLKLTSAPVAGDIYQPGEKIEITAAFDEPVILYPGALPTIQMNLGQELWTASYDPALSRLAGPNKVVFTLPVPAGASGTAALGQNALQDRTQIGNIRGVRVHPFTKADLPGNKPLQAIIGQLPGGPTMVWGEFDGGPINGEYYQPGELLRVHTRWDRPIKVDQKKEPYLMLKMRAKEPPVRANYNRAASQKSGTNTAIFSHRIRPGDTSPNGVVIGENGSGLRGASSITDHSGNPASGEWFPDIIVGWKISREQEFYIVQAAVTSVPINGNAYQAGETIEITLEASGPVFVDDKSAPPYVLLTAGNRRVRAHYHAALSRAAGANKLIFTWRVPEGHEAIEKKVASTPLNGAGSVQNAHRITGPDGRRIDPRYARHMERYIQSRNR